MDVRPLQPGDDERARRIAACVDRRLLPKLAPLVERVARLRDRMPASLDAPAWYDPLVALVTPPPALAVPPLRASARKVLAFDFVARTVAGMACLGVLAMGLLLAKLLFDLVARRDWQGLPTWGACVALGAAYSLSGMVSAGLCLHAIRRAVARSVVVPALLTPAAAGPATAWPWRTYHVAFSYDGSTYEVSRPYRRAHADLLGPSPDVLVDTKYPGNFRFKDLVV